MPSRRLVSLVLLLVCVPALVPCTHASARVVLPPYHPRSTGSRMEAGSSWMPEGPKPFVLGGVALAGTRSLLNAFLLGGGQASAGVELPAGLRGGAMNSPGIVLEACMAFGAGAETPVSFELSLGVSF